MSPGEAGWDELASPELGTDVRGGHGEGVGVVDAVGVPDADAVGVSDADAVSVSDSEFDSLRVTEAVTDSGSLLLEVTVSVNHAVVDMLLLTVTDAVLEAVKLVPAVKHAAVTIRTIMACSDKRRVALACQPEGVQVRSRNCWSCVPSTCTCLQGTCGFQAISESDNGLNDSSGTDPLS